jgi:hypothetical protein
MSGLFAQQPLIRKLVLNLILSTPYFVHLKPTSSNPCTVTDKVPPPAAPALGAYRAGPQRPVPLCIRACLSWRALSASTRRTELGLSGYVEYFYPGRPRPPCRWWVFLCCHPSCIINSVDRTRRRWQPHFGPPTRRHYHRQTRRWRKRTR